MILFHCIGIARSSEEAKSALFLSVSSLSLSPSLSLSLSLSLSVSLLQTKQPKAYLVLGLNTVCDVYFAGSIDLLCDAWSLTPDVAGATSLHNGRDLNRRVLHCTVAAAAHYVTTYCQDPFYT